MKVKAKWIVSGVFECVQDSGAPPCGGSRALQVERLEALTSAALEGVLYGLAAALRGSGEVRGLLAALAPKIEASADGWNRPEKAACCKAFLYKNKNVHIFWRP